MFAQSGCISPRRKLPFFPPPLAQSLCGVSQDYNIWTSSWLCRWCLWRVSIVLCHVWILGHPVFGHAFGQAPKFRSALKTRRSFPLVNRYPGRRSALCEKEGPLHLLTFEYVNARRQAFLFACVHMRKYTGMCMHILTCTYAHKSMHLPSHMPQT